jgi:hypothetical protein
VDPLEPRHFRQFTKIRPRTSHLVLGRVIKINDLGWLNLSIIFKHLGARLILGTLTFNGLEVVMIRPLFFLSLCLSLFGCASPVQTLESKISALHDYSLFKDSDERLVEPNSVDDYQANFTQIYCGNKVSPRQCSQWFDQTIFSNFSELYFAADPLAVKKTCANEPLICDDLVSLETLFRRLHNASIEESKQEKLSRIEDWKRGKLTDDELKAALHLDFKFEDGKLLLRTPSA